ncbi:MAG: hypothetical protein R3350_07515, partial [Saprospiraceae bacterium]|nr:hypothetical protein [Saprospiraceae bacterium]
LSSEWGIEEQPYGYQLYPHRLSGEGFYLAGFRKAGEEGRALQTGKAHSFGPLTRLARKKSESVASWLDNSEHFIFFETPGGHIISLPVALTEPAAYLSSRIKGLEFGTLMGQFKREQFVPAHELALSIHVSKSLPRLELDKEQALRYLKKEDPGLDMYPRGWMLVTFEGNALGWAKGLGKRLNNYYPRNWRIRMDVGTS